MRTTTTRILLTSVCTDRSSGGFSVGREFNPPQQAADRIRRKWKIWNCLCPNSDVGPGRDDSILRVLKNRGQRPNVRADNLTQSVRHRLNVLCGPAHACTSPFGFSRCRTAVCNGSCDCDSGNRGTAGGSAGRSSAIMGLAHHRRRGSDREFSHARLRLAGSPQNNSATWREVSPADDIAAGRLNDSAARSRFEWFSKECSRNFARRHRVLCHSGC